MRHGAQCAADARHIAITHCAQHPHTLLPTTLLLTIDTIMHTLTQQFCSRTSTLRCRVCVQVCIEQTLCYSGQTEALERLLQSDPRW